MIISSPNRSQLEQKLEQATEKGKAAEKEYLDAVNNANQIAREVFQNHLPPLLDELQDIEFQRQGTLLGALNVLSSLQVRYANLFLWGRLLSFFLLLHRKRMLRSCKKSLATWRRLCGNTYHQRRTTPSGLRLSHRRVPSLRSLSLSSGWYRLTHPSLTTNSHFSLACSLVTPTRSQIGSAHRPSSPVGR